MSVSSNYYLDSASLATATRVFLDADLTVCAPDGFYSDGAIVREQVSCVLGNISACPACSIPCGEGQIINLTQGYYTLSYNVGSGTGAIVFQINPFLATIGVIIEYDNVTYSNLVSSVFGYLGGVIGLPTYIGSTPLVCFTPPDSFNLTEYVIVGGTAYNKGTTIIENVTVPQCQFTPTSPGTCYIVIPKTTAVPSTVNITLPFPCSSNNVDFNFSCPAPLEAVSACDTPYNNPSSPCTCSSFIDYYVSFVNGSTSELGLYDIVFTDINGQTPAADGYYRCNTIPAGNDWFRIQNGIITQFGTC